MLVLVNFDKKNSTKAILEISFATYDENVYIGNNKNSIKGLLLYASNNMVFIIKNISKSESDYICKELYTKGKANLTRYETVEFLTCFKNK